MLHLKAIYVLCNYFRLKFRQSLLTETIIKIFPIKNFLYHIIKKMMDKRDIEVIVKVDQERETTNHFNFLYKKKKHFNFLYKITF